MTNFANTLIKELETFRNGYLTVGQNAKALILEKYTELIIGKHLGTPVAVWLPEIHAHLQADIEEAHSTEQQDTLQAIAEIIHATSERFKMPTIVETTETTESTEDTESAESMNQETVTLRMETIDGELIENVEIEKATFEKLEELAKSQKVTIEQVILNALTAALT